jgi:hypothetical protein
MATTADGGVSYGKIEAMLYSDSSSSEESHLYSRRGGARPGASGASKLGKKTTVGRVKGGAFVGPGQSELGFGKDKKALLKPAEKKTQQIRRQHIEAAELRRKQASKRLSHERTSGAVPPYLA